ncbi:MAG: putative toxin-antitoxin system toxin component, PIN family [Rhodopila sp.]|jgi:putative PIN family toxin of toxin-antitoxin system
MTSEMLLIVLDTDVLVAAFDSPTGASRRLVLAVFDGAVKLLMSTGLLLEYEAVLTRPTVLRMIGIESAAVLDELAGVCVPVALDYRWRPVALDPDDDMVIETAINGGADAIATFNIGDMHAGAERFGIRVERPATILRRMRS